MKKNIFKLAFVSLVLLATACTTDSESDEIANLAQL